MLFREIRKEFAAIFSKEERRAVYFLGRYPRQVFACMVLVIILSSILAFFIAPFENNTNRPEGLFMEEAKALEKGMSGEVSALLEIGNQVKRIGRLKSEMERIIGQKKISGEDSIFLENAILELENYNNQNKRNHED